MDILKELEQIQAVVLERAAKASDMASISHLGKVAQQCQVLAVDARAMEGHVRALRASLNGAAATAGIDHLDEERVRSTPRVAKTTARRTAGAAREAWVKGLTASGILLTGHGKKYRTVTGKSVGVAFANELPGLSNKWFLGLVDEPTDVAALLCRATDGKLYDLVLPIQELGAAWESLSRSGGQVKFNVRKDPSSIVLLVPGGNGFDVTQHVGSYESLH